MDTTVAASYMALSETSFRGWAARVGVQPVDLGMAVTRWRKGDLDALVEALPGRSKGGASADTNKAAKDALERVRRRAR